jgi:Spy/CpxP family protein refolding chaperone
MFEEVDEKMFDTLTEEQQKQFHEYMEQVINNLKAMEENQT